VLLVAVTLAACEGTGPTAQGARSASPGASPPTPAASVPAPSSGSTLTPPSPPRGTGINGLVVVTGSCPVVREDGCPDKPIAARLSIMDAATGSLVTTVDSDKQGRFSVALAPGHYLLRYAGTGGAPPHRIATMSVTVDTGRYTTVTVRIDSGIQ
jgi:hypothetical protein